MTTTTKIRFGINFVILLTLLTGLFGCGDDQKTDSAPESQDFSTPLDPATEEEIASYIPPTEEATSGTSQPFPSELSFIGDIAYDKSNDTMWALAGDINTLDSLVQIDSQDGTILATYSNPDFFLNHGSELAFDGQNIWATTYGLSNGVPQSFICKLDTNGNLLGQISCPSSDTGGYCEGLAWDGQYLWTGATDNKNLARYDPTNGTTTIYENFWDTIGSGLDIAYDPTSDQLAAKKDGMFTFIEPQNGSILFQERYDGSINKGDWTGELFWFADYGSQTIIITPLDPATDEEIASYSIE